MTYRIKTLPQIIDETLSSVLANCELTDANRGSIIRTIVEAASLQDADQYIQISLLKSLFSFKSATGADLDERALDFKLTRAPPTVAQGRVKFGDRNFTVKIEDTLSVPANIGDGTLTLTNASNFPASGAVLVERDILGARELLAYTSKAGNVLTLAAPATLAHAGASSVILSTVGQDRVFGANLVVSVPATDSSERLDYTTVTLTTLLDGDIVTLEPEAISTSTGAAYNVGNNQVILLPNPPFPSAYVTNDSGFAGGQDEENDTDLQDRISTYIAALTGATAPSLLSAALSVQLSTGERVLFAQVVEEFSDPDVTVYIDDGNGTATTSASQTVQELLIFDAEASQKRAKLANWPVVSGTLNLKQSIVQRVSTGVTPGVGDAVIADPGASFAVNAYTGMKLMDSNKVTFPIVSNTANDITVTVTGQNPSPGLYVILSASFLVEGTDYLFNETTGDIELVVGLAIHSVLVAQPNPVAAYSYYTGLIQLTQKVLKGDPDDLVTYPGVASTGIKLKVKAPTVQTVSFSVIIDTQFGILESTVVDSVKSAIVAYVNGLGIGADVIVAEIIYACLTITGVTDAHVNIPSTNVVVPDGVIPRTNASLITLL